MGILRLLSYIMPSFFCRIAFRCKNFLLMAYLMVQAILVCALPANQIVLAKNGKAEVVIRESTHPGIAQKFATQELAKYLERITKASFTIQPNAVNEGRAIRVELKNGQEKEAYSIAVRDNDIILSGNSDRAILYAVYDFLNQLGCIWIAPDLELYEGRAEIIPSQTELIYSSKGETNNKPVFAYRKIDVDGGRTHNGENLKAIIDWMAKVRYNTLRVPVNLNGNDRVQWDKWRETLLPELKKRDMLLEVGGHGYQNFLNAGMENGNLFKNHPDWFAKDSTCRPTPSERLVFNTSNPDAVNYFTKNVISYIQQHPEINILGMWPPDVGRWADCKEFEAFGTPADRQAAFTNKIVEAVHAIRPDIVIEIIAYSYTLLPPAKVKLDKNVQVDFCPINQSFEKQIFDGSSQNNSDYVSALKKWKQSFPGEIGLYSYYRKYAWRSAPNVIPRYIQKDMQWFAGMKIQGISTYAEPGDWFTYELNHFILAQTSWNPGVNVMGLCDLFYKARYGELWKTAKSAYESLEKISPVYGSIPFTSLKKENEIRAARNQIEKEINNIKQVSGAMKEESTVNNFSRLLLMLQYLQKDLLVQEQRAAAKDKEIILEQIKELLGFLEANLDKGVFILTGQNDLARFTKKYGLTNQSLLD